MEKEKSAVSKLFEELNIGPSIGDERAASRAASRRRTFREKEVTRF